MGMNIDAARLVKRVGLLLSVSFLVGCSWLPSNPFRPPCPIVFDPVSAIRVEPPRKIILEFSLRTCDGNPVPDLKAEEGGFVILEDEAPLSKYESKFKIQPSPQAFAFESLLLLDMSGSILGSGDLPALQTAAKDFVADAGPKKKMAIYAFEGGTQIKQLVDFTDEATKLQQGIQDLGSYKVDDDTTNLYGAVSKALQILDGRKEAGHGSLYDASLTVFTDGTQRAGTEPGSPYPSKEDVLAQVAGSSYSVFTIGLGGEIDEDVLRAIGRNGFAKAANAKELPDAFARLKDFSRSSYVLAYCSPKRIGKHTLQIQAKWNGMEGKQSSEYDAAGFSGECVIE